MQAWGPSDEARQFPRPPLPSGKHQWMQRCDVSSGVLQAGEAAGKAEAVALNAAQLSRAAHTKAALAAAISASQAYNQVCSRCSAPAASSSIHPNHKCSHVIPVKQWILQTWLCLLRGSRASTPCADVSMTYITGSLLCAKDAVLSSVNVPHTQQSTLSFYTCLFL